VVLPVNGDITKAQHIFIRRALKVAERASAKAVILDMDTYGGDLSATNDIQKALLSVKVPTYAFINTNAGSAGALISLATKHIWMAPTSAIGAAAPVGGDGQDLQKTMNDKVLSFFSAKSRSIAEQQGHNPDIAEAFMNKEKEVKIGDEIISPKGQLLTLDANNAARWINGKPVLADGIATSISDLAKKAKIEGNVIRLEPTGFEKIAQFIASLAPLFLLGGLVCAYLEFKIPGATLPGVLAVIFFAAFFGGHYLAGLAGFETIALFLLGVTLILVELVFFPGVMAPAVIGAALMLAALVLAMADRYPSQPLIPSFDSTLAAAHQSGPRRRVFRRGHRHSHDHAAEDLGLPPLRARRLRAGRIGRAAGFGGQRPDRTGLGNARRDAHSPPAGGQSAVWRHHGGRRERG